MELYPIAAQQLVVLVCEVFARVGVGAHRWMDGLGEEPQQLGVLVEPEAVVAQHPETVPVVVIEAVLDDVGAGVWVAVVTRRHVVQRVEAFEEVDLIEVAGPPTDRGEQLCYRMLPLLPDPGNRCSCDGADCHGSLVIRRLPRVRGGGQYRRAPVLPGARQVDSDVGG